MKELLIEKRRVDMKRTCKNCNKYPSRFGGCFHAHTDDTICKKGHITKEEFNKGVDSWDITNNKYKELEGTCDG